MHVDVMTIIDQRNQQFIGHAKEQLKDLSRFSTDALEWLMVEHYQFSFANTKFLATAADVTGAFDSDAVRKELLRNCAEENGHAAMYRKALAKIGINVETRVEFPSTSRFLGAIGKICQDEPSSVLGVMFATETAAIFEHEVFLLISKEVIARRGLGDRGGPLVYFHDMHLSGVEQGHRDELGVFIRGVNPELSRVDKEGERPTLCPAQMISGAMNAISAMEAWWAELFAQADARTTQARTN